MEVPVTTLDDPIEVIKMVAGITELPKKKTLLGKPKNQPFGVDLGTVNPKLNAEDKEIMNMFRSRRDTCKNYFLVVEPNGKMYLLSKDFVFRKQQRIREIHAALPKVASFLCVCALVSLRGWRYPVIWAAVLLVSMIPFLLQIPKQMKGGIDHD